jgi:FkbM family methyltransferase
VLSFEPTPNTFGQLMRNTVGNDNVLIHNCAAYSSETELTLRDFGLEYSAFNSAFGMRDEDTKHAPKGIEFQARARKVDDVVKERGLPEVDLVKIDAESSELHVLQGMTEIIKRDHPRIILETGNFRMESMQKTVESIGWLREFGYKPFKIGRDNILRPASAKKSNFESNNLLFSMSDADV